MVERGSMSGRVVLKGLVGAGFMYSCIAIKRCVCTDKFVLTTFVW